MSRQFEMVFDNWKKESGSLVLELDGNLLSFNGSIVEFIGAKDNKSYVYLNYYIPIPEGKIVYLPKSIVDNFDLYNYCDDTDMFEYEELNFAADDFNLDDLFES